MDKYKTLKTLSGLIIFIAWFGLISAIIVTGYLISNELDFMTTLPFLVGGLIGFILFLAFGKGIQLLLDIRENQIQIKDSANSVENQVMLFDEWKKENPTKSISDYYATVITKNDNNELTDISITEANLSVLDNLIIKQKKTFLGAGSKSDILILLSELITSKEKAFIVIDKYNQLFNKDIIEELKGLSSSYAGIKDYLSCFIEHKIVDSEHPHDLLTE